MWGENVWELIGKSSANFVIYDTPATKLVYLKLPHSIKRVTAQQESGLGPQLSSVEALSRT